MRKFHLTNSNELNILFEESKKELESLEYIVENDHKISEKIEFFRKKMKKYAELLSRERHKVAEKMDKNIVRELQLLGMEKAKFKTQIASTPF